MLSDYQRAARYLAQTGRAMLTPRQRRRIKHKAGHQSVDATHARESQSADRKERAVRKRRSTPPVQGAQASVPDGAAPGRVTGPNHNRESLMKRIIFAAMGVIALLLGGFTTSTASAATADIPGLRIGQVGYNAVGNDRDYNRNAEYIDVSNVSGSPVNVKDLLVRDSWARSQSTDGTEDCNTFKVTELPGVTIPAVGADEGKLLLQPGHTVRVYVGEGTPKVFGWGNRIHAVYKNSPETCGFHGHFLNNDRDTVWIQLGGAEERKSYDFRRGYYAN